VDGDAEECDGEGDDELGADGDAEECDGEGDDGLGDGGAVECVSDGVGSGVWARAGSPEERTREPAARLVAAIKAIRWVGRIRGLLLRGDLVRILTSCESRSVTDRDDM
jgi:hypothetical protein